MKKLFKSLLAAVFIVAALFMVTTPVHAAYDHYQVYVYKDTGFSTAAGGYTQITSDIRYVVFNGGTLKLATIYSDAAATAKTNPVEVTTFNVLDRIDFYLTDTVTTVDIAVMCLNGFSQFYRGVTTSTRTLIMDQRPGIRHHGFMDYSLYANSLNALTGAPTDYWTIPSDVLLHPEVGFEPIIEGYASDYLVRVNLGGTGAVFGLGGYFSADDAYAFQVPSNIYGVGQSITYGSVFQSAVCTIDAGTYLADLTPYFLESAATVGFEIGSCPDWTGNASDTLDGWGFFHFWFTPLR